MNNRFFERALVAVAAAAVSANAFAWTGGVHRQKFIAHGWDLLRTTPEEILDNAEAFGRTGVDGVTVCLSGLTASGRKYSYSSMMTDEPWTFEMFAPRMKTLQAFAGYPGLRESFLMFWLAPQKRIAWTDDATWKRFADNLRVLARVGAEAGMKGYFIDCEDYPKTRQFFYDPKRDAMDFDAARLLARQRGRELFTGLFAEHPNAAVLSFWFFTLCERYAWQRDPAACVRRERDLWPAFLNGVLDVMPPQAKFVDGNEWAYYNCYAEKEDFHTKAFYAWHSALGLVEPENRAKYKAQLSVSFGFYIDMFRSDATKSYYYPPAEDGSRLTRFERNLEQAARVSTEYVWIYGEKYCWVPYRQTATSRLWKDDVFSKLLPKTDGPRTWEEAIPGVRDMLDSIRDPDGFRVRKVAELRAAGAKDLIDSADRVPRDIGLWQNPEMRQGTFRKDGASVLARGVGSGCASVHLPATGGASYAVSVAVKGKGSANVHWKVNGKEEWGLGIPQLDETGEPDADGWRTLAATVRPPVGADGMVVSAWVSQKDEGEETRFRDFSVLKLR